MGSGDISVLQVIAQGTCNGAHGALVTVATGAVVASPGVGGTAGTYTITCDPGLPGDNSDAAHARVMITVLGGAAGANANGIVKAVVGGQLQIQFTTQVLGGAAADEAFDFIIWRDPAN
jgi:hypothetical protein